MHSGIVQIDQQEYKQSEISVAQYMKVLESICAEVSSEIAYFEEFFGDKRPSSVVVSKSESDYFDVMIEEKNQFTKRYIKTIVRDLLVSYSRYSHGFDSQVKRIEQIESLLKKNTLKK